MKIFIGLIVLGVGAAVLAYFVLLPWVVRQEVLGALRQAGWERATFQVSHASLWRAQVNEVVTEAGTPARVEEISIHYNPRGILRGELESIRLRGAELVVALPAIAKPSSPTTTESTTKPLTTREIAPSAAPLFDLPVDVIELVDSALLVNMPDGRQVRVPAKGKLTTPTGQAYRADLTLLPRGQELHVSATVDPRDGRTEISARSEALDLATAAAAVQGVLGNATVPAMSGTVDVEASFRWSEGRAVVHVNASPEDVEIRFPDGKSDRKPADKLLWSWGVLTVDATWPPDGTGPGGAVRFEAVDLEAPGHDLLIEGAAGTLAWRELSPTLATAPRQSITVDRLETGGMVLTNGSVELDAGHGLVQVHRTAWNWAGGTIAAENFTVDPVKPAASLELHATNLELRKLLELLAEEYARGAGRIDATLPITIDGSRVTFGTGSVRGIGHGQIQILRAKEIAAQVADSKDKAKAQMQQNIASALADFEYEKLEATLTETPLKGLMAHVRLAGRGRSGAKQPLDIELNVDGLDDLLRSYLGLQQRLSGK